MIAMQANEEESELFEQLKEATMSRTDGEMIRVMMRECVKIFLDKNVLTSTKSCKEA